MPEREGVQPVKGGPTLTRAQERTLREAMDKPGGRAGCWYPYGSGEWRTANALARLGLARHSHRRYDLMIVTNAGRDAIAREFGATTHAE
jgi:hypothetical protein